MSDQPQTKPTPAEEIQAKIEALTAQRAAYLEKAQAEVNHQLGVYDGRLFELKARLEEVTAAAKAEAVPAPEAPTAAPPGADGA